MVQITLSEVVNANYPISVYISDKFGNNTSLLDTISSGPIPPDILFNSTIPSIFETAPEIMITIIDSTGCQIMKILTCS